MLVLRRIDPSRNMSRFYALTIERSLFGDALLVRRWGRIGAHGRVRVDWFDHPEQAIAARTTLIERKRRRGYQLIVPRAEDGEGPSLAPAPPGPSTCG